MKNIEETSEIPVLIPEGRAIPLICAWCDKIVGIIKWKVADGENLCPTHGICPECFNKSAGRGGASSAAVFTI